MFEECYSLAAITIPGSVPSIGADAFIDCAGLGTVTIDNGVANIESNAFTDCSVLTSVAIPASVTNIGFSAFSGCTSLAAISVAAQNGFYSSVNGVLFDKGTNILIESPGGLSGHYTIPGGVTSIQNDAFFACANLTAITIPGSVTNIGANAFIGCSSLTALTIPGSVTSIGEGAFSETEITNFYFTGNAPEVDSSVFSGGPYPAVYYLPGTTGWAEFSANTGLPAAPWNPVIQTGDGAFGVQNNQFGFDITGPNQSRRRGGSRLQSGWPGLDSARNRHPDQRFVPFQRTRADDDSQPLLRPGHSLRRGGFAVAFAPTPLFFWAVFVRLCKYWLPLAVWMAVIFCASTSLGAPDDTSRFIRRFSFGWTRTCPNKPSSLWHHFIRKCAHACEYAMLGVTSWRVIHFDTAFSSASAGRTVPACAFGLRALRLNRRVSSEFCSHSPARRVGCLAGYLRRGPRSADHVDRPPNSKNALEL